MDKRTIATYVVGAVAVPFVALLAIVVYLVLACVMLASIAMDKVTGRERE